MQRIDYWAAVRAQPTTVATTTSAAREALEWADLPTWPVAGPAAVVAMGASTYAAEMLVEAARCSGRLLVNWPASQFSAGTLMPQACVIGISESGRSPETIEALRTVPGGRIVTTNVPGSPVTEVADVVVPWGGVADAGVYITGYTSSLVALAHIGAALGLGDLTEGLDSLPEVLETWLPQVDAVVGELLAHHFPEAAPAGVDSVGAGAAVAAAAEAHLLLREAARTRSAFFVTDQYLHGPAESLTTDQLLLVHGDGRGRELAERAVSLGIPLLHVAEEPLGDHAVALPSGLGVAARAVLEVVVGQTLAGRLGDRGGHEIGTFQHEFSGTKLPQM